MFFNQFSMRSIVIAVLVGTLFLLSISIVSADPQADVVATGLNNPRGMYFSPDGSLYITEAGVGGNGACFTGAEGEVCYGETGGISRVVFNARGEAISQSQIVNGLPSLAGQGEGAGNSATGVHDVYVDENGQMTIVTGLGGDPALLEAGGALEAVGSGLGRILTIGANNTLIEIANLAAYEGVANPDEGVIDTNPYSLVNLDGTWYVTDAGGNTLLEVDESSSRATVSTVATFAPQLAEWPPMSGGMIPAEAVPTGASLGPDANTIYAGQLTGFPFEVGSANVIGVPLANVGGFNYATGFTNIMDIGFDDMGNLYVIELTKTSLLSGMLNGSLIKVEPDGTRIEIAPDTLVAPTGLAVAPNGSHVCVAHNGMFAGAGMVTCYSADELAIELGEVATGSSNNLVVLLATAMLFTITMFGYRRQRHNSV